MKFHSGGFGRRCPVGRGRGRLRLARGGIVAVWLALVLVPAVAPAGGFLRVGISNDYPPFSTTGTGFSRAVATRLAQDLGFAGPLFVDFDWPSLEDDLRAGRFDLAISGITWRVDRSVVGWMSEALTWGGPCVVWAQERDTPSRVAVNQGGFLEGWVRTTLAVREPDLDVRTTEDNLELPTLLSEGEVDGFVTDSFEVIAFRERVVDGARVECEPPTNAKVIWVAPQRAAQLGPRVDEWIDAHRVELAALRAEWLGAEPVDPDQVSGLELRERWRTVIDLIARRQSFMRSVGVWKRERDVPIEDLEREALVLARTRDAAVAAGLDAQASEALFRWLMSWAKALQEDSAEVSHDLDLQREVRPELLRLGDRILASLERAVQSGPAPWPDGAPPPAAILAGLDLDGAVDGLFERLAAFRRR